MPSDDLLLAAQTAAARGDERAALDFSRRLIADPTAGEPGRFTAAVRLVDAAALRGDPNGDAARSAWECVRQLADSRGPVGLQALTLLSRRPPPVDGETGSPGWMPPPQIARALEAHPLADVSHRLLAMDLAAGTDPAVSAAEIDAAVARWRDADDAGLAALASWLLAKQEPARAFEVLLPARAAHDAALFLRRFDALAALNRWEEVKSELADHPDVLDPFAQHVCLALTFGHLAQTDSEAVEWSRAQGAVAQDANRLYSLGQNAESQGAIDPALNAYAAAIAIAPRMRPAHEALCRLYDRRGQTAQVQTALAAMLKIWPQDERVSNLEAYLRLLSGASNDDAAAIEKNAAALAMREPGNWQARATLALARLRRSQGAGALQAFAGLRAAGDGSVPPGALAIRAAALAAAGWRDEARADAHALAGVSLRPEERALIASLDVE